MQRYQPAHFMKNYYYFLGISENASNDDIKKAYRKLSLKYHPDKNPGDDFFMERFRETQEAYEMLTDPEKRRIYDDNFLHEQRSYRPTLPPSIKSFKVNKIRVQKGEEVIITWQTFNADIVKILPFGLQKGYGEKVIRITEFKDGKFQLLLHATNSLLNKTVVQALTITEVFENKTDQLRSEAENIFRPERPTPQNPHGIPRGIRVLIALMLIIIALLLLWHNFAE